MAQLVASLRSHSCSKTAAGENAKTFRASVRDSTIWAPLQALAPCPPAACSLILPEAESVAYLAGCLWFGSCVVPQKAGCAGQHTALGSSFVGSHWRLDMISGKRNARRLPQMRQRPAIRTGVGALALAHLGPHSRTLTRKQGGSGKT